MLLLKLLKARNWDRKSRVSVAQKFYSKHVCSVQPCGIPLEFDCPKKWSTLKTVEDILNRSTIKDSSPFTYELPGMIVSSSDDEA